MIAHPGATYADLGALFEVTPQFICMLVNTDMFQAMMRKKLDEVGEQVTFSVREKLLGLADMTIQRITDKMADGTASERLIGDTFGKTLAALGYGGTGAVAGNGGQTNIQIVVGGEDIANARSRAADLFAGQAELKKEGLTAE